MDSSTKTQSEGLFERFLRDNRLQFEKIKEDVSPRPDYVVSIGKLKVVFELKELAEDESFGVIRDPAHPHIRSHSRTLGDHIRRRMGASKKQIQYGAKQGIPSILLLYNKLDSTFQRFGTEDMDFIAAMYGEFFLRIEHETRRTSDLLNGRKRLLQENKNTSFSALGRLCDRGGVITVTLFENAYSKVKVPYEQLPPCFEVKRIKVSREPLTEQ